MILVKSSLTGLVGFSLCMANISGIVTDSAGVGIAGAFVKLEKCRQSDTTDSNGNFLLTISHLGFNSRINQALLNKLSATMHNGFLYVNVAEKSTVEITTFDLNGKALSSMCQSMDAGSHSIALPKRSAGIYLYKLEAAHNKFVLIRNAAIGIFSGSPETSQGLSLKPLAKQAKKTSAINDVIAATKTGYLKYRMVVGDLDTSGIVIKLIASAGTLTDADGNVYQTVRIGNQVWMAENLRATKYNDGSPIPLDTSTTSWNNAKTPKYCYYQNTTNPDSIKKYGALYNWHVVSPSNPKKIAPTGWHVPSDTEWDALQNNLIAEGYNWDGTKTGNKIAKSMAAKADWVTCTTAGIIGCDLTKNNRSGFSGLPGGWRSINGEFFYQRLNGDWWTATERDTVVAWGYYLHFDDGGLVRSFSHKSCGFSLRLVLD